MKDTVTYPLSAIMGDEEESRIDQLERELAAAIASFSEERERAQREGARVIKLQGELVEARAELVETKKELNDKSKFCYAVEQALDGLKGDYVEIILALRKDATCNRVPKNSACSF